jgi:1-deoxy-D-xylulose-5-phosphate reductoisomerase
VNEGSAAHGRPLRVAILGATGSIGRQALDVIDRYPDRFEAFGLVSGRRATGRPARFVVRSQDPDCARRVEEMVTHPDCDLVLVAIPGARSLAPTLAALESGKKVALASKEVLVMAGELVMRAASSQVHGPSSPALPGAGGREFGDWRIRPVDSEHSAIWQCLWGETPASVARLVLTASGGPFWASPGLDLDAVTVEQALCHPRWNMGPKVTIDSATLMNKGLEVIEAHHLFGVALERIDVVVHPQSVIHSVVEFVDGSAKAQLSNPDMRLPIGLALSYPERMPGVVPPTPFQDLGSLQLHPLDGVRFPSVRLAREAAARGGSYPAVLNAANEEAVAAFLAGRLPFSGIVALVEAALAAHPGPGSGSLEEILAADAFARRLVADNMGKVGA